MASQTLNAAPRRVLIIDDNVDFAEMLRELLQLKHHEVRVAFNGPQGLETARSYRPEVVLCDIGLPIMNGYDVARAFRAEKALRTALLVAITGYDLFNDKKTALDAGFDLHLTKPPDLDLLERLLVAPGR